MWYYYQIWARQQCQHSSTMSCLGARWLSRVLTVAASRREGTNQAVNSGASRTTEIVFRVRTKWFTVILWWRQTRCHLTICCLSKEFGNPNLDSSPNPIQGFRLTLTHVENVYKFPYYHKYHTERCGLCTRVYAFQVVCRLVRISSFVFLFMAAEATMCDKWAQVLIWFLNVILIR